ncbi:MAG: hypothetical protein IJ540_08255 [Prevotella sp.]|nr:hypothetical protein [Prevotella sp.]
MKTIKSLCAMLAVLAFTACSSNSDDADSGNEPKVWHITLQASMGEVTNRALSPGEDNAITASFAVGDEVKVLKANGSVVCTLTANTAGTSTTLNGTISGSFAVNEVLTLRYLSATPNYDGQDGTLAGISSYAEGSLKVSSADPLTFESTSVTLTPMQSITKFSFKDNTNANINVKTFGIAATGLVQSIAANGTETVGAVTGTLATPSSDVYVALRNKETGTKTYSFTIQDKDGNWYIFTKDANLTNGKNYTATVAMTKLSELSSTEGEVGVIDGLPAIVISGNKAVALMNVGALCPEHYGKYYTFAGLSSLGLPTGWYVPTKDELTALIGKTKAWVPQNGVNGTLFTIATDKTLFLPAAGYYDTDDTPGFVNRLEHGYYWSSTDGTDTDYIVILEFYNTNAANMNSINKKHGLTVRPFHSL